LINFHFGSKDELYSAVWERVDREIEQFYPLDGNVPADAPASERLRGLVSCLLNRALDPRLEGFHRIFTMEILNPTGLLDKVIAHRRKEHQSCLLDIIRELLAPYADDRSIEFCEMSVASQCRMIIHRYTRRRRNRYRHSDVESLTQHITVFSLAGINAVRQQIEEKTR
jgi:AcrR family transcriptional regulator